jgi:hypothetical protein
MNSAEGEDRKEARFWSWARGSWVGSLVRTYRSYAHEFSSWLQSEPETFPSVAQLTRSIQALRCGPSDSNSKESEESPIFLMSTGWRAGSTLLQRVLVTDPRLLVWGEPLAEMGLLSRLTEMVSNSLSPRDLKLWYEQDNLDLSSLTTSWIATLSPPGSDLRNALRGLFVQWLGGPARRRGFVRWGLKEVRLGGAEASLLYWLFPRAKFVVISRHPYDCYRSFTDSGWHQLYYRHPEVRIDSAAGFAKHWNRLALSWAELPVGFPVFHIKYEDLTSGKVDFRELESFLGIEINEGIALSASVGGTAVRNRLSWYERLIIAHETAEGMLALGYSKSEQGTRAQDQRFPSKVSRTA